LGRCSFFAQRLIATSLAANDTSAPISFAVGPNSPRSRPKAFVLPAARPRSGALPVECPTASRGREGHGCGKLTRRVKFRFRCRAKHLYDSCHPVPPRKGRWPSSPNVGMGLRWTQRHRARDGIAGRDKLRERSLERADERCRSVRQNRVDLTPQWLASSLRKASRPDRARMSRGHESPIPRGEREISRQAIAQGMSDVLRCPVWLVCSFFAQLRTRDRGCSAHPAFPAPSFEGQR
jgi:hypothetical protein